MTSEAVSTSHPVLVALDGSELSEKALPYAVRLARTVETSLHLVTVWEESERDLIAENVPDSEAVLKRGAEHWERYLGDLATGLRKEGLDVETEVVLGEAAPEILNLADRLQPGYLVVASHGRSGLSRWRYGSVAGRLVHEALVPTLIVGPEALQVDAGEAAVQRILVPLDGSPLAETALRPAADLADKLGAQLVIAQAVQWTTQAIMYGVADVNVTKVDDALTEAAALYLSRVQGWLKPDKEIETTVLHGPPADALIQLVAERDIDLVVMTSHTRTGVARAVLGSVADRLLQSKAPVLLVRPEQPAPADKPVRGRYCHNCGRASPYVELLPEDRCIRCGQHLRACANCVYFDGIACIAGRPEQHDTYPGRDCPYFHFRETPSPLEAMTDGSRKTDKT